MKMSFYKEDEDLFKELEEALQRNLSVEAVEASISVAKIIKSLQLKEYIVVTALLQYFYCFNPSLCKKELENVSKGLADYQNQSLIKSINLLEEYKDYLALFERLETYTSVELAMYKDEDKQNIFEKNINYYEQLFGNQECLYILTASRITELKYNMNTSINNIGILLTNLLKKMKCYYLINILENVIFEKRCPDYYQQVEKKLLEKNQSQSLYKLSILRNFKMIFNSLGSVRIENRSVISIFQEYGWNLEFSSLKRVPTIDLSIAVHDKYLENCTLLEFFTQFYIDGHCNRYFYITDYHHIDEENMDLIIIADKYHYLYRIILRKSSDYRKYLLGDSTNFLKMKDTQTYIIVFKRNGKTMKLPENSTVLDFAFCLNGFIGLHFQKAIINNRVTARMDTVLKSGDKVEIVISEQSMANIDWFRYVQTLRAKDLLIEYLKK